jgi:hypothetical protein
VSKISNLLNINVTFMMTINNAVEGKEKKQQNQTLETNSSEKQWCQGMERL